MDIVWKVLEVINWVVIGISTIAFAFQIVMILFFWMKEKHFKASEDYHRVAVFIFARNEAEVIEDTVKDILDNQDYPKDKYDVYVVADNCDDDTAALAEKAGAKVIVHNDPDPSHHRVAYPMRYGFAKVIESGEKYDFFIRFDADNHARKDFIRQMNNAFCSGVRIARPFEASMNGDQNTWSSVSATYYIRDSKIASNFRERFHLDSMLTGAGMMVAVSVLEKVPGYWDAMSPSEDAEFTLNRLMKKERVHYVADAIVYEDQPSTMKDTWYRISRMGYGLHGVFWRNGWKLLGHFFVSGRWSNVDLFVQLLMVPFTLLAFFWFVPYYVFFALSHLINFTTVEWMAGFSGLDGVAITAGVSQNAFINLLIMAAIVIGAFLIIYPLQTFLAVLTSKKKLGWKNLKGYKRGIILSPVFMMFYGLAIFVGVL
ncbi:MAG: glycosyltransferase, partial [Bacilli bacterium]|nr:glycosyltransferase [Bacilli bacterium]